MVPGGAVQHVKDSDLRFRYDKWEEPSVEETVLVQLTAPKVPSQNNGWHAFGGKTRYLYKEQRVADVVSLPVEEEGDHELCFRTVNHKRKNKAMTAPVLVDLHYLEARKVSGLLPEGFQGSSKPKAKANKSGKLNLNAAGEALTKAHAKAAGAKDEGVLERVAGVDAPVRRVDAALRDKDQLAGDQAITGEILDEFAEELKSLTNMLGRLKAEMRFLEKRDKRHMATLRSTDRRVEYLALFKLVVVIVAALGQVFAVQSLFNQPGRR